MTVAKMQDYYEWEFHWGLLADVPLNQTHLCCGRLLSLLLGFYSGYVQYV